MLTLGIWVRGAFDPLLAWETKYSTLMQSDLPNLWGDMDYICWTWTLYKPYTLFTGSLFDRIMACTRTKGSKFISSTPDIVYSMMSCSNH